jgi:Na+/proline symporter
LSSLQEIESNTMGIEFGLINWLTLGVFLLGTTWFGHKMNNKAGNLDDFFLGGRKLPWWAVSASIIASQMSAVTGRDHENWDT